MNKLSKVLKKRLRDTWNELQTVDIQVPQNSIAYWEVRTIERFIADELARQESRWIKLTDTMIEGELLKQKKEIIEMICHEIDEIVDGRDETAMEVCEKFLKEVEKVENVTEVEVDRNQCPSCGCLYDDKMKGAQGRNGACECGCGHKSPDWKRENNGK